MASQKTVLVVGSFATTTTANYIVNSLIDAGCTVHVCSDLPYAESAHFHVSGAFDIHHICQEQNINPDLVLFIEGGTMQVLPLGLEKITGVTAWYGIDTHMDYDKHLKISRLFDIAFIAQKEFVKPLCKDGIKQVYWLPLAYPKQFSSGDQFKRTIDIACVGSVNINSNPTRHKLISELKKNFPAHFFGTATPKEMFEIYRNAKIVFNKSVNNDINMRFFEAMGSGAVLVTDPITHNGLEDLFEEDVHYVTYQNSDDLIVKVKSMLANQGAIASIAKNAQSLVHEKHTYRNRAEEILKVCSHAKKTALPKAEDYFTALLTLNLYGPAIYQVAMAIKQKNHSGLRKYMLTISMLPLIFLSKMISLIEHCTRKIK